MEDHGAVYADPLQAGARIDRGDEGNLDEGRRAEYHGEFVNFDPMIARPKPGPENRIRRFMSAGAFSAWRTAARIRYGDGWIPGGDIREVLPEIPVSWAAGRLAAIRLRSRSPRFAFG